MWDFWFDNIGGKRLSSVWFLAPFNFCSICDAKISVNAAKSGNQTQTINRTKASGEKRLWAIAKTAILTKLGGILAFLGKKSAATIVWWHCAWFSRRRGFILSLWLSLGIHNCYLMARKEMPNKYSLLSCLFIFPVNNKQNDIYFLRIGETFPYENLQKQKHKIPLSVWICMFDMLSQNLGHFFIFCGGLTDCDRIWVRGDNEDMCALYSSCPLLGKGEAWTGHSTSLTPLWPKEMP